MALFKIIFEERVRKDFRNIPKVDARRILSRIESLAQEPRPFGCEKLTGQERYRIRQGEYRILYSIKDRELVVWVLKVTHRKDVYR